MLSGVNGAEMLRALPRIIGYGSLFGYTIWWYRKNRTVVLGAATVSLFFIFVLSSWFFDPRRVPDWLVGSTLMLLLVAGLVVFILAGIDVICWFRGRGKRAVDIKNLGQMRASKTK